jgi:predicted MFS family arabinose efflux permease
MGASRRAARTAFANPELRLLALAWASVSLAIWSYVIGLGVYAFDAGGTAAVGIAGLVRLLPGALASPFAGLLGDRHPRKLVLEGSAAAGALALGASALAAHLGAPAAIVIGLSGAFTIAIAPYVPAEGALLPLVSRTPQELAAANVMRSVMDNLGFLVGAALAGVLLTIGDPELVFALAAATALVSAALVHRLTADSRPAYVAEDVAGIAAETLHGVKALLGDRRLRLVGLLLTALVFFEGAADVLIVIFALDLLGLSQSAVGYLNVAWGIGALVAVAAIAAIIERGRLVRSIALGAMLAGLGMALPGAWPIAVAAYLGWVAIGIGYTLFEVAARTLLQRNGSDEVLARILGSLEALCLAAMALGSICVPALVAAAGARTSLIIVGALLPLLVALCWRALRSLRIGPPVDARRYALLRGDRIFAPLPVDTLERLAHDLTQVDARPDDEIITEGDHGDRFYLIDEGAVEVVEAGAQIGRQGSGESFGEIALIRDVPRTASVRALAPTRLFALTRQQFLAAVTGHVRSHQQAAEVTESRLGDGDRCR